VTSPDPAADGRRRADQLLTLVGRDDAAADALLADLTEVRDLVFVGAGLTAAPAPRPARCPPPSGPRRRSWRRERPGFVTKPEVSCCQIGIGSSCGRHEIRPPAVRWTRSAPDPGARSPRGELPGLSASAASWRTPCSATLIEG
jgi:hypothetical protein